MTRRGLTALDAQPPGQHLLLCGITLKQRDLFDLFEAVFLLGLDDATQHHRFDTPANAHRWHRNACRCGRRARGSRLRRSPALPLIGRE